MTRDLTRVIVTTDMEVDDMNSLVHLALYLNLLDVQAVVYTASQYHFLGDGVHTLGEVNPHWRTKGRRSYEWDVVPHEPDPTAGELCEYRPFPEHWIESLWSNEYAQAWPQLQANAAAAGEPAFPTPAQMIERTFVGNVAFEGDVREETEGSRVIAQTILDDDPRTLWLLSWGGMNTIVRALMSIAERYRTTPEWPSVQQRVYQKVRVMGVADGVGQDNSWLDHGRELFPELIFWCVPYMYGGYVDAKMAQPDTLPLFQAPWPAQNLTQGNGPLMARYMLYGDGKVYENEPERFQFGKHARLDWGLEGMPAMQFERGDFMAEGDSMTYIPLLPFGLVASQVYAVQSAFLGYIESVIASLNFRETEFDEFIELVSFYVINRLRHYREEPVADVVPQWLKNTVEAMHDKLEFGESALENMVRLSGKTQEYLTRATQRYYGKTPMQIINDIRINFAKKQLEITNYSVTDIAYESGYSSPSLFIKTFKKLTSFTPSSYRKHLTSIN